MHLEGSCHCGAVTFSVDGSQHTVPYDALGPGKVQVEFQRSDEEDSR